MAYVKITLPQGADWVEAWTLWTTKAKTAKVDLSASTAKLQLRKRASSTTVLAELSTTNGRIVLGGAVEGNIQVNLPQAIIAALEPGDIVGNFLLTDATGRTRELFDGDFLLTPSSTVI